MEKELNAKIVEEEVFVNIKNKDLTAEIVATIFVSTVDKEDIIVKIAVELVFVSTESGRIDAKNMRV
jgi:hypothetical protein